MSSTSTPACAEASPAALLFAETMDVQEGDSDYGDAYDIFQWVAPCVMVIGEGGCQPFHASHGPRKAQPGQFIADGDGKK